MNHGCLVGTIYRLYQKKIHLGSFVLFAASQGKEDRSVKRNERINQTTVMQTLVERLDRRNLFGLYEMWKNTISLRSVKGNDYIRKC